MNQQIKPSEWVILGSGAAVFLLTLPFIDWISAKVGDEGVSIWNTDAAFPLATYIPIIGFLMALQIGLEKFANVNLPAQVVGFSWPQIHLVFAVFAGLVWIGFLIWDPTDFFAADWGIGFWIAFLGSAGLITGAVMEVVEERKVGGPGAYPGPGQAPPSPF